MVVDQLNALLMMYDEQSSEALISHYLLSHHDHIIETKANELTESIGISKSTLHRFCKMIGLRNYTELQYQLFLEMSQLEKISFDYDIEDDLLHIFHLVKGKRRIIILGNSTSIASLMCYKLIFEEIGIRFELKMNYHDSIETLHAYKLNEDDVVIYVSLFANNIELHNNMFNCYLEMINHTRQFSVPFIYVGRTTYKNEDEDHVVEINEVRPSEQIYRLCQFFEKLHYYLENN